MRQVEPQGKCGRDTGEVQHVGETCLDAGGTSWGWGRAGSSGCLKADLKKTRWQNIGLASSRQGRIRACDICAEMRLSEYIMTYCSAKQKLYTAYKQHGNNMWPWSRHHRCLNASNCVRKPKKAIKKKNRGRWCGCGYGVWRRWRTRRPKSRGRWQGWVQIYYIYSQIRKEYMSRKK